MSVFKITAAVTAIALTVAPAAIAQPAQVTPEWMLGSWADTPDCASVVTFYPGGTAYAGGAINWRLEGSTMILSKGSNENRRVLTPINQDQLRTEQGVTSYRCRTGGPVTRDWLLGAWSDRPDCSELFTIKPDGTSVIGTSTLGWRLDGANLTLSSGQQQQVVPIERVDVNILRRTDNGAPSYRCG